MRFRAWLVLIVLTGASTVKTQVPTAGQPTFRTGTTLVEMAVVVLNDNGLAIDDLDPADFDVREDGEPRALTIFRRVSAGTNVHAGSSPAIPGALIETITTNAGVADAPVFVLLLDDLNTSPYNSDRAIRAGLGFLDAIPRDALVGVVFTSGIEGTTLTLGPPGDSHVQRVRAFRGQLLLSGPPANPFAPATIPSAVAAPCGVGSAVMHSQDCGDPTRAARRAGVLEAIAAALGRAGARRKAIFWVTEDMGVSPVDPEGSRKAQRAALQTALNGDVAVYPVSPVELRAGVALEEDDENPGDDRPDHRGGIRLQGTRQTIELDTDDLAAVSLARLARETGGRWIRNLNNLGSVLGGVVMQNSASYLLAYESPRARLPGSHRIEVRVRRPDARVFARRGYVTDGPPLRSTSAASADAGRDFVRNLLHGVVAQGRLPLELRTVPMLARGRQGRAWVTVRVDVAEAHGQDVDVALVTLDDRGRATNERTWRFTHPAPGAAWEASFELPVPRGTHQVRVAAATTRGDRTGLVMEDFQVVEPRRDLWLGRPQLLDGDNPPRPTLERAFGAGQSVAIRCEVAGRAVARREITMNAALVDDRGRVVRESSATLTAGSTKDLAIADVVLDTTELPAGSYLAVIEARQASRATAKYAVPLLVVP